MLNICTKCGYVQRELVCLLLPTSSVNNNINTCDFIYISLSCDYLDSLDVISSSSGESFSGINTSRFSQSQLQDISAKRYVKLYKQ
jgi:hypothetical protein